MKVNGVRQHRPEARAATAELWARQSLGLPRCGTRFELWSLAPEGQARSVGPIKPSRTKRRAGATAAAPPQPQSGPTATCAPMSPLTPGGPSLRGRGRTNPPGTAGPAPSRGPEALPPPALRGSTAAAEGPRLRPRSRGNTDTHTVRLSNVLLANNKYLCYFWQSVLFPGTNKQKN